MELSVNVEPERHGPVDVEDIKRDLSSEFSVAQTSCSRDGGEHLQVYLRVRPFTSAESTSGESQDCVSIEPPDTVLLKPPRPASADRCSTQTGQRFQFSQVYGPDATQRQLFRGTVQDLVKDVLRGENSLVFTYGVTNAGKTFTFLGPDGDEGVLPRTLALIFSSIRRQIFPGTSIKPHRCREFTRLSREQQDREALFKRSLLRQLKESDKSSSSLLNCSSRSDSGGSSSLGLDVSSEEDSVLELDAGSRFSVWVSFCEIYNENIHDLLEAVPCGAARRPALRLSQDVKGNPFVKDLRWVQVNSAEEAHWVMKLGKRNQSFSSTRLNQLSSRSHSIFSIRVLRIEDVGTPRVQTISELCLCDLAGSERCGKTQNKGERLKEAGNINTSLLILGKCINALRHNQKAKLSQHVPFRESKLTHYLQGFFCGHGKACMIVNINQCASMYDETLNVLKFSAVAQKVVVLSSRPPPVTAQRSSDELSFIINGSDGEGRGQPRRSSLIGWESSLEDVQEDEDDDDEEEMEETVMEDTLNQSDGEDEKIVVSRKTHQTQVALLRRLEEQLQAERAQALLMEAQVREDISREFSELFSQMQSDYNERLERETKILEERAERRLEIFKKLVHKMSGDGTATEDTVDSSRLDLSSVATPAEEGGVFGRPEAPSGAAALGGEVPCEDGRVEDEDRLRLESQLEDKCSEVLRLQTRVSELQERLDQESERSKEAVAALEKEKEEVQRRQEEAELTLKQQLTDVTDRLEAAERRVELEAQRARQALTRLQAAQKQQEEQTEQMDALSLELERLKQQLQASSVSSACEADQLREQAAELHKALDQERRQREDLTLQLQQLEEARQLQQQLQEGGANAPDTPSSCQDEDLRRRNAELQAELSSLRSTVSRLEDSRRAAELEQTLARREAELQEKEQLLASLQEKQEQEESQAVQEARRREVDRRRELLAAAQDALALKEEELQRNVQDINRLRGDAAQEAEKVRSLSLELQRREEEASDLREKLADYRKQVQQVHKEVSGMREEEKTLRQKLADTEKSRKQLQSDLGLRDRTIQQLRTELTSGARCEQTDQLYLKARQDLQAKERVVEDMRLALTEQEVTQEQMEEALEEKLVLVQELSAELEKLKAMLSQQDHDDRNTPAKRAGGQSEEAAGAQDRLQAQAEKHQEERRRWQEEKMSLMGQAKAAEERRNQEMRKFMEDRERYSRQQSQLESQLAEKQQTMDAWKKDRDVLVSALEVQLRTLISSQAEKDKTIQELSRSHPEAPAEAAAAELQAALAERDAEILRLKDELEASRTPQAKSPAAAVNPPSESVASGRSDARASVSSQGSSGCPSVLESSEISTENGRARRFPQPELEISFSPLQPNRMALRRQGQRDAVTVKITRSGRKRKSGEMEKCHIFRRSKRRPKLEDDVEAENRKNNRSKLTPHKEESESQSTRKEGTLQKIGDFLQSSPTLLSSKAKKMMSLVSGRGDPDATASSSSSSSLSLRVKKGRRRLYKPEISSPMEMPSHPIISREPEEKESDHQIIKRRLRSRTAK
ncbi:kinesin-like protein KIF20B [Salarias fasciatus]|uniref:kinesin-like protein KIF20B n=1 Tax=Salarias fasciatus TaxID=181472 RepID=UPI001176E41C|nr:kinesin-like protein KIF20B [Salarias fasciatus]